MVCYAAFVDMTKKEDQQIVEAFRIWAATHLWRKTLFLFTACKSFLSTEILRFIFKLKFTTVSRAFLLKYLGFFCFFIINTQWFRTLDLWKLFLYSYLTFSILLFLELLVSCLSLYFSSCYLHQSVSLLELILKRDVVV